MGHLIHYMWPNLSLNPDTFDAIEGALIVLQVVVPLVGVVVKELGVLKAVAGALRGAKGGRAAGELTRRQATMIKNLRGGKDVTVRSVQEARTLLDNMPEVRPYTGNWTPNAPAPKGTYRGDLINTRNPTASYVHPPKSAPPAHANNAHYNIHFRSGEKATIIIKPR